MLSFGNLAVVLTLMVVALSHSGSAAEKLASCCTSVDRIKIEEPILDYLVQGAKKPCVQAVIFQTASGLYCKQLNAPWVRETIQAFRKNKLNKAKSEAALPSATPSPKVSLLSIITSTVAPPSSSPTAVSRSSPTAVSRSSPTAVSRSSSTAVSRSSPTAVSRSSSTAVSRSSSTAVSRSSSTVPASSSSEQQHN